MLSLRRIVLTRVLFFMFLPALCMAMHTASAESQAETIFEYDFEEGWGDWYTDNGVWEIGSATAGPGASHGGDQCAGTVLSGDYPEYTDSRLISPSITLSSVSGDEELSIRFWHWFSYATYGYGYTQISTYESTSGTWSAWETLGSTIQNTSGAWSYHKVDITSYAGNKVRFAFYHYYTGTASWTYQSTGWYIDDIQITKKVTQFTGDFESGWGDWYSDNGVWEVGEPTAGPNASHGGTQCAATVLSGKYPEYTDSRLISPPVTLSSVSGDEELSLRFWHWFSYATYGYGYTQISTYESTSGTWSAWETLGNAIQSSSGAWSYHKVDITSYAGNKVRFAFYHYYTGTASWTYQSTGWYIDDVEVTGITTTPTPTPTGSPSPTPTETVPTPTPTPAVSPTPLPSVSPVLTPTPTPSDSPTLPPLPTPPPTPTTSPADEGSIYGFVKDEDELPLKNVLMSLTGPDNYAGSTKTDDTGFYTFEELAAGDYTLEASKSGYQTHTEDLTLGEDEELEVETIYLEEAPCGSIYGYVVNIRGDPVENARLKLRGLRKVKHIKDRAVSDKDGFFEFSKCLDAGKYVITVNKKRYRPAQKTVVIEEGEEKDIGEIVLRRKSQKMKMLSEEMDK